MPHGLAALAVNLGPTEILLILLVTVPILILPVVAVLWVVFRMGKRQGATEARRAMGADTDRDNG